MSLVFKYWIEFDEEGGIKSFNKSKYECESECKEYLVKLLPIQRDVSEKLVELVDKKSKEVADSANKLNLQMRKFTTELDKTVKSMKRIKIK